MSQRGEILAGAGEAAGSAPKARRCGAPTVRGGVCTAAGNMADGRCPHHTTTVSEKLKKAWRQRGHAASMRARMPATFTPADFASEEGARKVLEETANLVREGKLPVSVANAVSKIAGVAARLGELRLEEKLNELERQLAERGGAQRRRQ